MPEGGSREDVEALLDRLAEARLLTLGEGTAEVAHEVLIREWPTLRRLARGGPRGHPPAPASSATPPRLWEARGARPGDLYRGTRLGAARGVGAAASPTRSTRPSARSSTRASPSSRARAPSAQRRANRRLRALLAGAGVLLVLAVVAGLLALRESSDSRDAARTADAQRLGAQALIDDRLERSLLLAQAGRVARRHRRAPAATCSRRSCATRARSA